MTESSKMTATFPAERKERGPYQYVVKNVDEKGAPIEIIAPRDYILTTKENGSVVCESMKANAFDRLLAFCERMGLEFACIYQLNGGACVFVVQIFDRKGSFELLPEIGVGISEDLCKSANKAIKQASEALGVIDVV